MVQMFVHATDDKGAPLVAHHFEFEAVARVGEELVVDIDGNQLHLEVTGVTHYAISPSAFAPQVSNVQLACKLVK